MNAHTKQPALNREATRAEEGKKGTLKPAFLCPFFNCRISDSMSGLHSGKYQVRVRDRESECFICLFGISKSPLLFSLLVLECLLDA